MQHFYKQTNIVKSFLYFLKTDMQAFCIMSARHGGSMLIFNMATPTGTEQGGTD